MLEGARDEDGYFDDLMVSALIHSSDSGILQKEIEEYHKDGDYDFDQIFPGGPGGDACTAFASAMEVLSKFRHAINGKAKKPAPLANEVKEAAGRLSEKNKQQKNADARQQGQEEQKDGPDGGGGSDGGASVGGLAAKVAKEIESERKTMRRAAADLSRKGECADGGEEEWGGS
eukprot:g6026.t1